MEINTPNTNIRSRKLSQEQAFIQQGKIPPQSRELEEAVLGALMLDREAIAEVEEKLKPEFFYFPEHQMIYQAILTLSAKLEPIDILTVTNELRHEGRLELVGGAYYVSQLTSRVVSAANIEYHAHIIAQKYIQRELIRITSEITRDAYDETSDILEVLQRAEQELLNVSEKNFRSSYAGMGTLVEEVKREMQQASQAESGISGIPTGFTELDRLTTGFHKGNLIVLAARPGMGKTAFGLSMARNIAVDRKKPVAFFSLEMSGVELVTRLSANQTVLPLNKLKKGDLAPHEWHQYNTKVGELAEAPLYIDDTPQLTIHELRSKCRRLKVNQKVEMVFIDYLQLMQGTQETKGNRQEEISAISRQLKGLAKELGIPILAMSQLSRAVETRGGTKRPQLSDIRESGAIEQDADIVMFIYRPEYYGFTEPDELGSVLGAADIIVAKHRNGPTGDIRLKFVPHFAQFVDNVQGYGDVSSFTDDSLSQMQPNQDFDNKAYVTVPSRMNDMDKPTTTFKRDDTDPF